jgi:hypothetical protein
MTGRNIRYDEECDSAAEALGGYKAIDESLYAYLDALERNPAEFPKIDTDWGSVRYIRTKPFGGTPGLLWYFVLEANGDVTITYVEKY